MAYEFDYIQYHKYINDMVELLDDLGDPEIFKKLHERIFPIMELFGIAVLTNDYNEMAGTRGVRVKEFGLPPKAKFGEPNLDCEVFVFKKVGESVTVKLMAYPFKDAEEWGEEVKEYIRQFLNLYFHLIARVRVFHMFNASIFRDQDIPFIGNIRSCMRDLNRLQKTGVLEGYTAFRMNISNFSRFNRSFGRKNADEIMNKYIAGLKSFAGEHGDIYRLGGDNFIGVVPKEVTLDVHKYMTETTIKISEDMPEVTVSSRVGFYMIDSNSIVPDLVVKRISNAFAKTNAKNKIVYFDSKAEQMEEEEDMIENDLIRAMEEGEVVPFYQPKVNMTDGKIIGAEALCRWVKNDEIIPPYVFIPIIERTNRICALDFYMLKKVCDGIRNWIDAGHNPIPVSVNFSRNNLTDNNFVKKIIDVIDASGIPHNLIIVELTETTLEVDFDGLVGVVNNLKENGVLTAVDDFGMGYSSLNLIKDIKWDILKIDKSFVPDRNNPNYERYLSMLRNVVRMAEDINMASVIEGVETEEQLELARACGCRVVQGYYYDRPLSQKDFEAKMLGTYSGECKWKS